MGIPPDPAASGQPPGQPGNRRRRRALVAAVAAGLLVLAVVVAAYVLGRPRTETAAPAETAPPAETAAPAATPTPTETPEPPAVALNILLVGSDSRGNFREEEARAAAGGFGDQRSDALVLLHLPADRQKAYGISIMRDLWVDIPGRGASKINDALSFGGMPLVVRTVEALLGAHIDHTVMMDFAGFKGLTDALGGIEVDVKRPFTSTHDSKHDFPAGVNQLNGAAALEFVRERKAFPDGDYQRVRNQQTFLRAVLAKAVKDGALTSRTAVRQLVTTVLPYVWLDPGFTSQNLESLGLSLRSMGPENAVFFTLPTAGTGTSRDGRSIVLPDAAAIAAVAAALRENRLGEYVTANGLQGGD
ncbi:LCP family protein [Pseudarthrobacter albicanus]|uniref:LCP family protein n=1 Tax=Pseudarthrobacter albicanus TaxID=2823873 RepID=UPI001BAC2638|nr:LCP family protein [Pseudarthrobacter albicanus]